MRILKSRQGLRVRRRLHVVSPGGNGLRVAQDFLDQQRHEQFAVQPSLGAVVIVLGQMPEPGQRLEAFEDQLDLPAQAAPFQHVGCRKRLRRVGRKRQ